MRKGDAVLEEKRLLDIQDLVVHYHTDNGVAQAVNGVTLWINSGETLGLVGETGAGKTTTALAVMRLLPEETGKIEAGSIIFDGEELLELSQEEMRRKRGEEISMIFQDPMTALNPVLTVGDQISEVFRSHHSISPSKAMEKAGEMLEMVGIPRSRLYEYPHQFSGGMKQRVVIAMALACRPKLIIADEPTTALDVTIQAQVLELLSSLQKEITTAMLLITHDLGVVAHTCDRVAIMYGGEIIEYGDKAQIFDHASHPYTLGLFGSIPDITKNVRRLTPIDGLMPEPFSLPQGCKFANRCSRCTDACRSQPVGMTDLGDGHLVRCILAKTSQGGAG